MKESQNQELILTERIVDGRQEGIRVTIVDFDGKITIDGGASTLREDIEMLLGEGVKNIVLNMDTVVFVDSSGYGVLLYCFSACKKVGATLKVLRPEQKILDNFYYLKLFDIFEVFHDEATAIASF